jgi:hypothetical protein
VRDDFVFCLVSAGEVVEGFESWEFCLERVGGKVLDGGWLPRGFKDGVEEVLEEYVALVMGGMSSGLSFWL